MAWPRARHDRSSDFPLAGVLKARARCRTGMVRSEPKLHVSTSGQRKRVFDVTNDLGQRFLNRHPIRIDNQLAR